jgi:hypothetical protein
VKFVGWMRTRHKPWRAYGDWQLVDVRLLLAQPVVVAWAVLSFGTGSDRDRDSSPTMKVDARPGEIVSQLRDGFATSPITVETCFGQLTAHIVEVNFDGSALLLFQRHEAEALLRKCDHLAPPLEDAS